MINDDSCTKWLLESAIDWRGKVSPCFSYFLVDSQRFSAPVLLSHSYMKYHSQKKPRPRTAPISNKSVKTKNCSTVIRSEKVVWPSENDLLKSNGLYSLKENVNPSSERNDDCLEVATCATNNKGKLNLPVDDFNVADHTVEPEASNTLQPSIQNMVPDATKSVCLSDAELTPSDKKSSDTLLKDAETVSSSVVKSTRPTFCQNSIKAPHLTPPKRSASSIPTLCDRRCLQDLEAVGGVERNSLIDYNPTRRQIHSMYGTTKLLPNGIPEKRRSFCKGDSGQAGISQQQRTNDWVKQFSDQLVVRPTRNAFSAITSRRDEFKLRKWRQVNHSRPTTSNACTADRLAVHHVKPVRRPISCTADHYLSRTPVKVEIAKIFRASSPISNSYLKKLDRSEVEKREDERKAALTIQRNYRLHLQRRREIERRAPSAQDLAWSKVRDKTIVDREVIRQDRMTKSFRVKSSENVRFNKKLMIIGPHVEIYSNFHPPRSGPSQREKHVAALTIQKSFRGWLTRRNLKALHRKARYHGKKLSDFLRDYFSLMRRIQMRAGIRQPVTRFVMKEIDEFMDMKKKYEIAFDSRAFCGLLAEKELKNLFKDCYLCPAGVEIENALDLLFQGPARNNCNLNKKEVLELFFTIYKPPGSGLAGLRRSTWMHPIIDQEDAIKHLGPDEIVNTPLSKCLRLLMEINDNGFDLDKKISIRRHIKQLEDSEKGQRSASQSSKNVNAQKSTRKAGCINWLKD